MPRPPSQTWLQSKMLPPHPPLLNPWKIRSSRRPRTNLQLRRWRPRSFRKPLRSNLNHNRLLLSANRRRCTTSFNLSKTNNSNKLKLPPLLLQLTFSSKLSLVLSVDFWNRPPLQFRLNQNRLLPLQMPRLLRSQFREWFLSNQLHHSLLLLLQF